MEQMKETNTKKAALIATAVVLVIALLIGAGLLFTVKNRVAGVWAGGPVYLKKYGSYCSQVETFGKDGAFVSLMFDASGNLIRTDIGTWEVSGFEVRAKVVGNNGHTAYHYNPISNKLTSGSWTYTKTE